MAGRWTRLLVVALLAAIEVSMARAPATIPIVPAAHVRPPSFDGTLSVLTYNVRGMPWPVAIGRSEAFAAIAARLLALRANGAAPHVIVLQEAFTAEARALGRAAGYRFVAEGPAADLTQPLAMTDTDRAFVSAAHWWNGETQGKLLGSGLQILSDYPIVAVRRLAFPDFACAGYDCLANKGALQASIDVPGMATPIDIVATHLNSHKASGVSDARSNRAYLRQLALLGGFVRAGHDARRPLIVAGDFNAGKVALRRAALISEMRGDRAVAGGARDALHEALRKAILVPDAGIALRLAKDWQFFASGAAARIDLETLRVPFGHDAAGAMLSDHIGYVAGYRLTQVTTAAARPSPITRNSRSKA